MCILFVCIGLLGYGRCLCCDLRWEDAEQHLKEAVNILFDCLPKHPRTAQGSMRADSCFRCLLSLCVYHCIIVPAVQELIQCLREQGKNEDNDDVVVAVKRIAVACLVAGQLMSALKN